MRTFESDSRPTNKKKNQSFGGHRSSIDNRFATLQDESQREQNQWEEYRDADTRQWPTPKPWMITARTRENLPSDSSEVFNRSSSDDGDDMLVVLSPPTHRVAIVQCHWDSIRTVDLFAVLSHHLPPGGCLKQIQLYPSDIGRKQMKREARVGPLLLTQPRDSRVNRKDPEEQNGPWTHLGSDQRVSSRLFREYESQRMRYYYAMATFDSAETASHVVEQCDGLDLEGSGSILDLQFVSDSEQFKDEPIATVTHVPTHYFSPLVGSRRRAATTQSHFELSWDADDCFREDLFERTFVNDDDDDEEVRQYITNDSSTDQEDQHNVQNLLEALNDTKEENTETLCQSSQTSHEKMLNQSSDDSSSSSPLDDFSREMTFDGSLQDRIHSMATQLKQQRDWKRFTLGERAERIHRNKRKVAKKAKADVLEQLRQKQSQSKGDDLEEEDTLQQTLGKDKALPPRHTHQRTKRMERREEGRERKAKAREERQIFKRLRDGEMIKSTQKDEPTLDERFRNRLLFDPRFTPDLSTTTGGRQRQEELAQLAQAVVKERREKREKP